MLIAEQETCTELTAELIVHILHCSQNYQSSLPEHLLHFLDSLSNDVTSKFKAQKIKYCVVQQSMEPIY
jgi:hypothetical protein